MDKFECFSCGEPATGRLKYVHFGNGQFLCEECIDKVAEMLAHMRASEDVE